MSISETLRAFRKCRGWTQAQLALFLGCSYQAVSNWERGWCDPPAHLLDYLRLVELVKGECGVCGAGAFVRGRESLAEPFDACGDV